MGISVSLYCVSRKLPKDLEYKTLTSSRASWFDMEVQKFCVLALVALAWNGIHAGCPRPSGWCSHEGTSFALKDCDGDGVPDPTCSDTEGKFGVISSNDYCSDSWPKGRCGSDACGDYGYIGCYVDDSMRDLNDGPKAYGYNQASCKEACKQYTYFALQHNGWCVCGNGYGTRPQYVKKPDS